MEFNGRDEDSIRASIRDADVVINLIGKYYETKHIVKTRRADGSLSNINFDFDEVHCEIPRKIARIAKEQGAKAMIHVSALAASPHSESKWSRSKAAGELAVRQEFPEAVSTSTMFPIKPPVCSNYHPIYPFVSCVLRRSS